MMSRHRCGRLVLGALQQQQQQRRPLIVQVLYQNKSSWMSGGVYARRFMSTKHTRDSSSSSDEKKETTNDLFQEQMMELHQERQALYGFTDEEYEAWSSGPPSEQASSNSDQPHQYSESFMQEIHEARMTTTTTTATGGAAAAKPLEYQQAEDADDTFTHLSSDGTSVHMVDVGAKTMTRRVARAQSKVVFPPEVMLAFSSSNKNNKTEWIGKKGPIFATAKLAGIMAAKRTSDLIPLCHPLPLDKVHVDIRLDGNVAIIECECRVTHKTGVEMEALTGVTVAALTIYDMVKAVSHRVCIEGTVLLSKTGGKRTVSHQIQDE